jgi:hypothetical protein
MGVLGTCGSLVLLGLNEPRVDTDDCGALGVGNVVTSVSRLRLEVALQLVAEDLEESCCDEENIEQAAPSIVVLVAEDVAKVASPSAQPAAAVAAVDSPAVPAESLESFIASLKLPLEESLIASSPIRHVSHVDDSVFILRWSDRLASKSIHRDPNPEMQAKRVLLNKWTRKPASQSQTPDSTVAVKFHEMFAKLVFASKRTAMREQFPMARACLERVLHVSD